MPTTTQFQPQNPSSPITVSGVAYSTTLAQGNGSANPPRVDALPTTAPVRRFYWFGALLESPVAIPALFGFIAPFAAWRFHTASDLLLFYLPAGLSFTLGLRRKKKRSGFLTGALLGVISCTALFVVEALRHGQDPDAVEIIAGSLFFAVIGAAIGTFAAGIRQGAEWLFGSNQP